MEVTRYWYFVQLRDDLSLYIYIATDLIRLKTRCKQDYDNRIVEHEEGLSDIIPRP